MKKILLLTISILLNFSVFADGLPIQPEELPANAKTFIAEYFSKETILLATFEKEVGDKSYEVKFKNGSEIEFDKDGNWTSIEVKQGSIPIQIISKTNSAIYKYISTSSTYKQMKIKEFSIKDDLRKGYSLELENGIELEFDKKGNFLRID